MKMVDVGSKEKTERVAVAQGRLRMLPATVERIRAGQVEKGDVLAAARLAGIMAVKRTPDLVPLCHPIAIAGAEVQITLAEGAVEIRAEVKSVERTGVEMEALTAVCAAGLTVYDMLKSVDRGMQLEAVRLTHKSGGKSGTFEQP
jgi:cyclic pyranopterin phosphate synthase